MSEKQTFLTDVGRIIQGSLYKPQTTDQKGNPLVVKSGPNMGKPMQKFFVAVAIPKVAGQHWATTKWGEVIWRVGHASFPQKAGLPNFAWKVIDGDSVEIDDNGKRWCDKPNFPGNWVLRMSSGYAPQIYRINDQRQLIPDPTPDLIVPGDYVEVFGNVEGNGDPSKSGVYLNHSMFCLRNKGERIFAGPDPTAVGFGGGQLPPGAALATGAPVPPAAPGAPGVPPAPGAYAPVPPAAPAYGAPPAPGAYAPAPPASAPAYANVPPPVAQVPVTPNPAFLQPPAVPGVPTPPPLPVAPVGPQMTALAGGTPYEAFIATGQWTDALLRQHGYML